MWKTLHREGGHATGGVLLRAEAWYPRRLYHDSRTTELDHPDAGV